MAHLLADKFKQHCLQVEAFQQFLDHISQSRVNLDPLKVDLERLKQDNVLLQQTISRLESTAELPLHAGLILNRAQLMQELFNHANKLVKLGSQVDELLTLKVNQRASHKPR